MIQKPIEQYDVIIIGGGIIGLTLACILAQKSLNITVIEAQKNELQWDENKYDMRVSAINAASQNLFQKIQAWPLMENMRVSPYHHMHVWDAASAGEIHFDCTEVGAAHLGHIVENNAIQLALLQCAKRHKNIQIQYTSPRDLSCISESIFVTLENEKTLSAKLLIGADGTRSWVRERARIAHSATPYQQTAIVTTVRTEKEHQKTAWQRFLPDSTLAFLPLKNANYCSIVWSVNNTRIHSLTALDEAAFNHALNDAFENTLGAAEIVDKRLSFPLIMRHAKHYVQPRIALVGDAARTIHPLAGQGVNLGLLDAAKLMEAIQTALDKKQDIGNILTLRNYERARKADNLTMIAAMEGFRRLFNNDNPLLSKIRSFGLQAMNKSSLKNLFIKKAMGLSLGEQRIL